MPEPLNEYLRDKRALLERHLRASLRAADDGPAPLREAMAYGLLAPGKRLRPLLVLLASEACGAADVAAMPAACAVEMIHAYSLIHDDLPAMDDDDLRRGQPTCHKQFGEALAILAGDGMLTLAFQVLVEGYAPTTASACCRELARGAGAVGMVGGQVEDLSADGRIGGLATSQRPATLAGLENIHARKTGALFRTSLRLGAWVAQGEQPGGPNPDFLDALDGYGRCFGQAFQITDDLLDVEGSAEKTGKRVQKDAGRGKLTYPGFLGREESHQRARMLCREAQLHLAPLGSAGERLSNLVQWIVSRDR